MTNRDFDDVSLFKQYTRPAIVFLWNIVDTMMSDHSHEYNKMSWEELVSYASKEIQNRFGVAIPEETVNIVMNRYGQDVYMDR